MPKALVVGRLAVESCLPWSRHWDFGKFPVFWYRPLGLRLVLSLSWVQAVTLLWLTQQPNLELTAVAQRVSIPVATNKEVNFRANYYNTLYQQQLISAPCCMLTTAELTMTLATSL